MHQRSPRAMRPDWPGDGNGDQMEQSTRAIAVDAGGQDGEGQSPGALWAQALEEGERRLSRRPLSAAATALGGGSDAMTGAALAAARAASLPRPRRRQLGAVPGSPALGGGARPST